MPIFDRYQILWSAVISEYYYTSYSRKNQVGIFNKKYADKLCNIYTYAVLPAFQPA